MINVKKFVYDQIRSITSLTSLVSERIYPNVMPQTTTTKVRPVVIYQRIAPGKLDGKGIRNEYIQVSIWGKEILKNEQIMGVIATHFNQLKTPPVKHCDVGDFGESFDQETQTFGNHFTVHIKLIEK